MKKLPVKSRKERELRLPRRPVRRRLKTRTRLTSKRPKTRLPKRLKRRPVERARSDRSLYLNRKQYNFPLRK